MPSHQQQPARASTPATTPATGAGQSPGGRNLQPRGNSAANDSLNAGLSGPVDGKVPEGLALRNVGASFRLPGGVQLVGGWNPLQTTAPTNVSVQITRDSLRVSCWPALLVDAVWPLSNVSLRGMTWSLRTGQLAGVDVENEQFAIPAAGFVSDAVGDFVRGALAGTPLARPGYDPFADPNLAATLASVQAGLSRVAPAGNGGSPVNPNAVDQVRLDAGLTVTRAINQQAGDGGVSVPAGTQIDVSALLMGSAGQIQGDAAAGRAPRGVQSLWISSSGITLSQGGAPVAVLEQLSVERGGRVDVSRFRALGRLAEAEDAETGLRGLALLFQLAAARGGHNPGPLMTNGSPDVVHGVAERKLEEALTAAVRQMIQDNARAVPGVDLASLFGVEPARAPVPAPAPRSRR